MAIFEDREKGFEQKYKHDQELDFKVKVRANKMLGLWIAGLFGMPADEADAYAKTVVAADLERPGDDDVVEKVMADFKALHNKYRHTYMNDNGKTVTVRLGTWWVGNPGRRQYDGGMRFMPSRICDCSYERMMPS